MSEAEAEQEPPAEIPKRAQRVEKSAFASRERGGSRAGVGVRLHRNPCFASDPLLVFHLSHHVIHITDEGSFRLGSQTFQRDMLFQIVFAFNGRTAQAHYLSIRGF